MKPARRCSIPGGAEPRPATAGRSRGMIDPGAGWIPRPWSIPMRPAAAASIARHCLRAIPASFIEGGPAPIAHEALERIAALYAIENRIRGRSADERRAIRQTETRPLVEALKTWLENRLAAVSEHMTIFHVMRLGLHSSVRLGALCRKPRILAA